jgi:uncharacterized membrane protein
MADITITLDLSTIKKYWLSASVVGVGIWTSLNPAAQQQIIHYLAAAVHQHPTLTFLAGLGSLIVADLKQSPIPAPPKPLVREAPPYVPPAAR